ncbi:MAG TPA: protein kinase, partial [Candidatus Solibacter sp.]
MSPSDHPERTAPGHVLAERFRIVRFLGRGGMGEVYEAADLVLNQHVALKLIRPESRTDPRLISLLRDEVRKARAVSHANVCRVYDLERDEVTGLSFVIMELLRGETLHARLNREGPFSPAEALPILRQIADGIDAIHAQQMVHLDLKPANVMLEPQSASAPRAVVNDFGLAQSHAPKDSSDSTESLLEYKGGTPLYMAPERFCRGAALTSAVDVYAFGLIAYEMLAGSAWPGPPGIAPPSLRAAVPDVPAAMDAMVKRCLSPQPLDRFPSCGAAIESLKVGSEAASSWRPWKKWSRRRLAIAGIALASTAGVVAFRTSGPEPTAAALRWYNEGIEAIREGTYYKAVRALDQSLKESPGFPPTHASLAEAWVELDSPERAAEEMLAATGPGTARYRIGSRRRETLQAIHHTVTRDFASAAADYKRLAESAPADERPRAMVDLGRALERAREPRKAMEQYETAVRLDPNYGGAYLRLGILAGQLQQADKMAQALQRAESLYEAASNLEGVTEVYYQRGAYARRQAHLNDAAQWLERARQSALATHNPHQEIRALQELGAVAYQKGDTAAGQKFAEDAIREAHT